MRVRESGRDRILSAVIAVIAADGLSRLTHRRVAAMAGVSLAATTYHYASKGEMVRDASATLLRDYMGDFERMSARSIRSRTVADLDDLVIRLQRNAAGRARQSSLAWCEIMIDAARSAEGQALARQWFDRLRDCWRAMFTASGEARDDADLFGAIDAVVGMIFIIHGLRLDPDEAHRFWADGALPVRPGLAEVSADEPGPPSRRLSPKAAVTRERIVESAIGILESEGPGAISYRVVAEAAGVSQSAPAYYFSPISLLLREAETMLFRSAKTRYREAASNGETGSIAPDALADLTSAIFIREATAFSQASVAHYSIWLEAARDEALCAEVADAVQDQDRAWRRRLGAVGALRNGASVRLQAVFIGQLVRVTACGGPLALITGARPEFMRAIERAIAFS